MKGLNGEGRTRETKTAKREGGNRYTVEKRNKFTGSVLAATIKYNTH